MNKKTVKSSAISQKNIEAIYPLSPMQHGMLFHSLCDPESGVYVEQIILTLQGDVHLAAFQSAWQQVVDRHSIFRTSMVWENRQTPLQVVWKQVDLPWTNMNWLHLSPTEQKQQFSELLVSQQKQGFHFKEAPLMDCTLIQLTNNTYQFIWKYHHVLIDGWCLPIIFKEVLRFYEAQLQSKTCYLPAPTPYRDYIIWLSSQDQSASAVFWKQTLRGFLTPTPFAVDLPKYQQIDSHYLDLELRLSISITHILQSIAKQHHLTLSTIVQAAWGLLLSHYSGEPEVMFGVTVAGRPASLSGVENMVGLFINTLPLRLKISSDQQFVHWLSEIQQLMVDLQHYSYKPLVEIQSLSEIPGGTSLFESIVVFENYPIDHSLADETDSLQIISVEGCEQTNYPLTLTAASGDELLVKISYDSGRFSKDTMERMLGHLQTIFSAIASDPHKTISEISLLNASERHQLLSEWNNTVKARPHNKCVHLLFEDQVKRTPEAIAVVFEEQQLSYLQLNEQANQVARYLQGLGVGPEILVGIYIERSPEMIVGLLGILKAGGAYVPLDPSYPMERLSYMLTDSGAELLLTQQALLSSLPLITAQIVCLDTDWEKIESQNPEDFVTGVSVDNLAYVIYTSGSTGQPKGVAIEHQSLANFIEVAVAKYALTDRDRFLQFASISFDTAAEEIYPCLVCGATLVLRTANMLDSFAVFLQACQNWKLTVLDLPTAFWHQIIKELVMMRLQFPKSLRLVVIGGEQVMPEIIKMWCAHISDSVLLINTYGPTEATVVTTMFRLSGTTSEEKLLASTSIGQPIENTQVYILDKHLELVPIGVPGEIYIGGNGLARGYLHRPQLTQEKFITNPFSPEKSTRLYKTGDLARYLSNGNIDFLGRIDSQVKIRGFRVELGEIEGTLSRHPHIQQAVVIATEDSQGNKQLVAYIVNNEESSNSQQLRAFLQQELPTYMIPSCFVVLDNIPLTPNGKVDRKALPPVDGDFKRENEYIAPRTASEEVIANIFATVLNVTAVGVNDDFFGLGGHSLLATQLISRLRQAFDIEIPIKVVFESPTIVALDKLISELRMKGGGEVLPAIGRMSTYTEKIPLSFAQERLWFLNQLEGAAATYNIPATIRLSGELNIEAFEQSLSTIVNRHHALRTSFVNVAGSPHQVIHSEITFNLELVDLQHLVPNEREIALEKQLSQAAMMPFDLEKAPLLRCILWQLSANEYVCLINMHHIVSDGWSIGVIIRELVNLYPAYCVGEASPLPELEIQYADFAVWQREWLEGEVLEKQLNYWTSHLRGAPELLQLPTDRPRPSIQTYRGATQRFRLDKEISTQLQSISRKKGSTLFMTLLSAFATLLYRYSGQSDIVIGVPIANRHHKEIESLIGFFVNTLALRTRFEENVNFEKLLEQARANILKAYEHQDVPFERIVEALQPKRSLSYSPLFQVMFVLQNEPMEELELPGVLLNGLEQCSKIAKFDLTLSMCESSTGLECAWEYNTDLFDGVTIERMTGHFHRLLSAIVENPSQMVSDISLLSAPERQQLLYEWNNTVKLYPKDKCIQQLFEEQVARTPAAIALMFEDQHLSYGQLNERANQLAHYLRNVGVSSEVLVGICVERSIEMVVGLLGILKAGGAYLPLDPEYPLERLIYIIEDTQVSVLITQQFLAEKLCFSQVNVVFLDQNSDQINCQSRDNPTCNSRSNNLAYVTYTSGSTGKPKGVCTIHQGVVRLVKSMDYNSLNSQETFLQFAPTSFDASTFEIWGSLLNGARLAIFPPGSPSLDELGKAIRHYQVTVLWLTAGLFHLMVDEQLEDLMLLHQLFAGGDVLSVSHVQKFLQEQGNCKLINGYGPTENTTFTCFYRIEDAKQLGNSVPIGKPIANTQVYILDAHLQLLPIGVPGELYIGGDGLAKGYLNRPELTQEKFILNPFSPEKSTYLYKTGDLTRYLIDGNIEFLGRLDNQVKICGFRIELGEIENVLCCHPYIQQAVVIAMEDSCSNKLLVAYVASNEKGELSISLLRDFLQKQLPAYMVPNKFVILESIPLTQNGKVDRKSLPITGEELLSSSEGVLIMPRDTLELSLAQIWSGILNLNTVGVTDNFFELGGHSLLAVSLMSQIRQQFQINLPITILFQNPTIEHLARLLRSETNSIPWSVLVPIKTHGNRSPLFCIHAGGGNVLCYQHLAYALSVEQPVYALQSFGLNPDNQPHTSIEQMATYYIQELQTVQPHGPYFLSGWSSGGLVAFEMAQQLSQQGEQIALLALIDSHPYSLLASDINEYKSESDNDKLIGLLMGDLEYLQQLKFEDKLIHLVEQAKQKNLVPDDFTPAQIIHLLRIWKINDQALKDYKPQYFKGTLVLFLASDCDSSLQSTWCTLAEKIKAYPVTGKHSDMLEPPHVNVLSERLQENLNRAYNTTEH
jgi:amino acid adenylation domain-containing protein